MSARAVVFGLLLAGSAGCSTGTEPPLDGTGGEAGASGASGASGSSGSTSVVCDPRPPVIDPTAIVDDMEDRDGSLTTSSGRNGSWWTAADETPGGTIEPRSPVPEAILGGRCGSSYAMRVTGQGFDVWGSLLGLSLVYTPDGVAAHDASFRQGVRFWARVGDTSTRRVIFNIGDFHAVPEAGYCVEDGEPACFTYQVTLSQIDTTWKQYVIPFGALVKTASDGTNERIDPSRLYTMSFFFLAESVFDLWVDDIEFY
jgi:hypothetical protein